MEQPKSEQNVTSRDEDSRSVRARRAASTPRTLGDDRYELIEFVNKGGMGTVYRARDRELDRWVAVKCLHAVDDTTAYDRAVAEAKTLASLSHQNILRIYDILISDSQVAIVSEWLHGQCLTQLSPPLSTPSVIAIMTQVYSALSAAHEVQVIHRDIKPSNIMIDRMGKITLIDFGVAYRPGFSSGETLVGSLRYTDPRILEGQAPDVISDMFSASLVQLEIMTGETVLPNLAPLPLYRHVKKNLATRIEGLLNGAYPPLANIIRKNLALVSDGEACSPSVAREAALITRDLLRKISDKPPDEYLSATISKGVYVDAEADAIISREVRGATSNRLLTPKQRAQWIAHQAAISVEDQLEQCTENVSDASAKPFSGIHALMWALIGTATVYGLLVLLRPTQPIPSHKVGGASSTTLSSSVSPDPAAKQFPLVVSGNAPATVIVDGEPIGQLPSNQPFYLTKGSHVVRLENPVMEPVEQVIRIIDQGSPQRLNFTLQPKVKVLRISLSSPGNLFIDGIDHGVVKDTDVPLVHGNHMLWVQRENTVSEPKNVAINSDTPKELRLE